MTAQLCQQIHHTKCWGRKTFLFHFLCPGKRQKKQKTTTLCYVYSKHYCYYLLPTYICFVVIEVEHRVLVIIMTLNELLPAVTQDKYAL